MATLEVSPQNAKYLTFQISRQYFAIRSERVRHILPSTDIHAGSKALPCVYGSVATRGRTIPVLDAREKLGLDARALRSGASVLVISLGMDWPLGMVGLIVDKLSEVIEFRSSEIRGSTAQLRIQGRPYGRPKTVLQPESLLTQDEWLQLRGAFP